MTAELLIVPRFLIYLVILLAGITFGALNFKQLSIPYRLLTQMLCLVLAGEVSGVLLIGKLGSNYPVYHLLQIISVIYYGVIFYHLLQGRKSYQLICMLFTAISLAGSLLLSMYVQGIHSFPSYASMLLSIFVVSLSLLVLYRMLLQPTEVPLLKQAVFWFTAGSLFFYALTFFVFGYLKVLLNTGTPVPQWIYYPVWMGNYLLYGSYLVSLYFASGTKPTSEWKLT